jgi:hypothetical protein
MGAIRDHWVIEWQKRGAPHLHGFAYFCPNRLKERNYWAKDQPWPEDPDHLQEFLDWLGDWTSNEIRYGWLDLSQRYRTSAKGQHCARVHGLIGWLAYLMKHASRGADHYQRQRSQLPAGWQKSGRLWGKGGSWPTRSDSLVVDDVSGFRFRRVLRAYGRAQARTQLRRGIEHGNLAQIATAKRALAYHRRFGHSDRESPEEKRRWSAVRGSNVTIPGHAAVDLLEWAIDHEASTVSEGATVIDREPS